MNVGRPVVDDARDTAHWYLLRQGIVTNTAAVEDRTTASTVAPTVASADTPVVATANGGTASESGVAADDVVDSIAALKPTTAVTGALSENAVAADGIAVDERTASTTATITTTVDTLTPVEETIIAAAQVVHVEDVSVSITAKTSSALAVSAITTSAAEETVAHSSANNGTSSAESTQRGKRTR
ncbi:hypothetical protein BGZ90_008976 [Linnemannia elongata]|nr:hypothetical protein BGZ90_008976 [Linnemannia elongata]